MAERVRLNRGRPAGERLLSKRQVAAMLGVHWTAIDRWRRADTFPVGIRLTDQVLRWRATDVANWVAAREADHG